MMKKITEKEAIAKALEGSIDKWQKIVDYLEGVKRINYNILDVLDRGGLNCPLCRLLPYGDCSRCPVAIKVETDGCYDTPFMAFRNAWHKKEPAEMREYARKELEFLKSLREK